MTHTVTHTTKRVDGNSGEDRTYLPQYTERKGSKSPENGQTERPDTLRNQQVRCSSHPTSSRHRTLFECGAFLYSNRITLKDRSVTGRSGLSHDLLRIVIILAAGIDFQLHAEVPRAIAAKQRSRLVVIIVDGLFPTYAGVAVIADRSILVAILIVRHRTDG